MDPMTMMLIMGGANAGLSMLSQKEMAEQAKQDKLLNAQIARYKPWTGQESVAVTKAPGQMQALTGGAMSGAQFGLGLGNAMKMGGKPQGDFQVPNGGGKTLTADNYDPQTIMLMNGQGLS
jgi:hypothetical protein